MPSQHGQTHVRDAAVRRFNCALRQAVPPSIQSGGESVPPEALPLRVDPAFLLCVAYPVPQIETGGEKVPSRIVEMVMEWLRPICLGEQIFGETRVVDLAQLDSGTGWMLQAQTRYATASGERVADVRVTTLNDTSHGAIFSSHRSERRSAIPLASTRDCLAACDAVSAAPGDVLFSTWREAFEPGHQNRWTDAIGPIDAMRPVFSISEVPGWSPRTHTSSVRTHAPEPAVAPKHQPQTTENGTLRFAFISSLLTNWAGQRGCLKRLRVAMEAPHLQGVSICYTGTVTAVHFAGPDITLTVSIRGVDDSHQQTTTAVAEILLQVPARRSEPSTRALVTAPPREADKPLGVENLLRGFLTVAQQRPESVAVATSLASMSYGQLLQAAERLARALLRRGLKTNDVLGLYLPRGPQFVVAIFAALLAGAPYIVLDPEYPDSRVAHMTSFCTRVLCANSTAERASQLRLISLNLDSIDHASDPADHSFYLPLPSPRDASLAYLMFTSGSTGEPRAVEITRGALRATLRDMQGAWHQAEDVCLHTASFSFSASIRQLLVPLAIGAAVFLCTSEEARDPATRLRLMRQHGITVWDTTPSGLSQTILYLNRSTLQSPEELKLQTVLITGEPLAWQSIRTMRRWLPDTSYVNLYAQTESTGAVCAYRIPAGEDTDTVLVPVGTPLSGTRVAVLDPQTLEEVPVCSPGQIYVQGSRLACGYRNDPQATASRFLQGLPSHPGRWYRTGDIGWRDADGTLTVTGRSDSVVNVRGARVALAEVEISIAAHPLIQDAAVVSHDDEAGTTSLEAFVTAKSPLTTQSQLRAAVHGQLPTFMRPRHVHILASMPRLPGTKIDRRSLPLLIGSGSQQSACPASVAASEEHTELQSLILALIQQETGTALSLDEPFLHAGLDSLIAVHLAAAIEERLGRQLTLTSIYEASTVRGLTTYLCDSPDGKSSAIVPLAVTGSHTAVPLFYVPGLNGHPYDFLPVAALLGRHRHVFGLQYPREAFCRLEDAAAYLVKHLLQIRPSGGYLLAGHSLGGRVAFEMARQLQSAGYSVAPPLLLDASAPLLTTKARCSSYVRRSVQFSVRVVRSGKEGRLMRAAIRRLRSISPGVSVQPVASGNFLQVLAAQKADTRYRPMPFDGKVRLLKVESAPAINRGRFGKGQFYGWERLALGGVEVIPIPGDHNSCLRHKDHIPVVALCISNLLAAQDLSLQAAGVSRA